MPQQGAHALVLAVYADGAAGLTSLRFFRVGMPRTSKREVPDYQAVSVDGEASALLPEARYSWKEG